MANAREIRKSLINQLIARGADVKLYRALIDDYMWFYQQFHQMQADIKKRGRTYTTVSAQGKDYEKNNPCVKDALLYSHQMVTILSALGLSTEIVIPPETGKNAEKDSKHPLPQQPVPLCEPAQLFQRQPYGGTERLQQRASRRENPQLYCFGSGAEPSDIHAKMCKQQAAGGR